MVYENCFSDRKLKKIDWKKRVEKWWLKNRFADEDVYNDRKSGYVKYSYENAINRFIRGAKFEYKYKKLLSKLRDNWACPDSFLCSCKDGPWDQCPHKHISKPGHENYEEKCWRKLIKELEMK